MTRERIEDMREVVLPFVKKRLLETNYENLGKSDAEEFARDFNEILNLANKALEQEPTEKIHSKTCETCRYFRKYQNKKNIELCKELYGESTICGHCTYWEVFCEVALPTTEYDYCSHHGEVKE